MPFKSALSLGAVAFLLTAFAAVAYADSAALRTITSDDPSPLPTHIAGSDARIHYEGRFDTTDPSGPRCSWSASTARVKFQGSALDVDLNESDGSRDEYEVEVDGQPASVLVAQPGAHTYRLYDGVGSATHTLALVKRTEAFCGIGQVRGFDLPADGKLLDPGRAPRKGIEVIGDSISCGYGNEGKNQNEHFSPTTENAYYTYGAIAARDFGAQYTCVAWSGKKMWPNNDIPSIYDLALPTDPNSHWDFSKWKPDVVVINLSTNDWGRGAPEEAGWTSAYEAFINRVRKNYPKAIIYCCTSPMMSGDGRQQTITYLTKIVGDENTAGDKRVALLEIPMQDMQKDGLGSDWHPNIATHEKDAALLEATIEKDLGWKPVNSK
ncbi:MAG TPA: SGNH/GDSL hydrolase family protein [Capsulimonadaceae bacterium]|nr:SGNH/GDSL hydrolase family protein [Capsulimonadaceae bacterium]